jgi:MFS family permease
LGIPLIEAKQGCNPLCLTIQTRPYLTIAFLLEILPKDKRIHGMKRAFFLIFLFFVVALVVGVLLTDVTPLGYDDWEWRYGARVALAVLALVASGGVAWRLPMRQRWMVGLALVPLLLSVPYIQDLRGGTGRQYLSGPPVEAGGEPIHFEQLWLPYTDRILE